MAGERRRSARSDAGRTRIALDTNVLIDLARNDETAIDCLHTIRDRIRGAEIIILPTVIQELTDIHNEDGHPACADAKKALQCLLKWEFQPINYVPVRHGIIEEDARRLRNKELLPEMEVNDSLIVAEAALIDAAILVTSDRHILEIDPNLLKIELSSLDVGTPLIASPRQIVRVFFQR